MSTDRDNTLNAWESAVAVSLNPTDTTLTITTGDGVLIVPNMVSLVLNPDDPAKREYIQVTGVATDALTIVRYGTGSAATSGITHDVGDVIRSTVTAQVIRDLHDRDDAGVTATALVQTNLDAHDGTGGVEHPDVIASSTSGFMTGADKAKLDGSEAAATADQTASEILAAIITVDGTGSSLDADLLDGVDGAGYTPIAHVGAGGTAHADVVAAGADGFMTGADKTKLDGVTALADVTAAQNALTATTLETARTIDITGDITAPAQAFDGSANIAIVATVNDDSHAHVIGNVDSLQTNLDARYEHEAGSGLSIEIGTSATPPAAAGFTNGSIYLQYTA